MTAKTRLAYLIEPRFPGGTSSAVAQEICALAPVATLQVHAARAHMFDGHTPAPQLIGGLARARLPLIRDAARIEADTVILHNPSFLKFETDWPVRIVARHLIVVAHENFLRPGGIESFDVAKCLRLIDRASLALRKTIAPISPHNRATVSDWAAQRGLPDGWDVLPDDWFNICDFEMCPPTAIPADRRGRHSRPGFEKFADIATLDRCFPRTSAANVILGGDTLLAAAKTRPHWTILPFQGIEVSDYFEMIDFMVYFTAPTFRESFGRVLAEAVAAGKIAISDPATASAFGGAVIGAAPHEVDGIVARLVADPAAYRRHVLSAQRTLGAFSGERFRARFGPLVLREGRAVA